MLVSKILKIYVFSQAKYLQRRITEKSEAVFQMVEHMFTVKLITGFNPTGRKGLRAFNKLKINRVVRGNELVLRF